MRADRLLKLAHHLEAGCPGGHEVLDMEVYNNSNDAKCGTAGCAIGELPIVFPEDWEFGATGNPIPTDNKWLKVGASRSKYDFTFVASQVWFDISEDEWDHLFLEDGYPVIDADEVTPSMVAARIREFVAAGGEVEE